MADTLEYCKEISNNLTAVTSLVMYEGVIKETTSFDKTASVTAEKAAIDTSSDYHLVMGYTKIKVTDSSNNAVIYLEPVKVEYDKQIYKPGLVKIHMSIVGGNPANYAKYIKTLFLAKKCNVSLVSVTSDKSAYHYIAKWYYVHNVSMSRMSDSSSEVTLMCYSPDKRLTLNKYCQVYSGLRLGQDILIGTLTDSYNFERDSAPTNGNKDHFCCNLEDLVYLGYDSNYGHTDANADELLQPYSVQYNESFYDFVCRIANRCGEFFYYEDGTLRLGLPEDTRKLVSSSDYTLSNSSAEAINISSLRPVKVTYPEINIDYNPGITTEDFYFNPTRQDATTESNRLSNSLNNSKFSGYTVDSNKAAEATSKYYNTTIATTDPLYCFFMGDIPDYDWNFKSYTAISAMSNFASAEGWIVALGLGAWDFLKKSVSAQEAISTTTLLNKVFSARRLQKEEFENILYKDSSGNIDVKKNFTMMKSIYDNLCSKFYEGMERKEDQVTREKVTMDFNSTTPTVKLGSAVNLDDGVYTAYIVTAMRGEFTRDSRSHIVEAVPAINKPSSCYLGRVQAKALLLPPNAVPHIREVASQEAIVMENVDPLELGRVRVKYLWQPTIEAKEEDSAAKEEREKKVNAKIDEWKKTEEYEALDETARKTKETELKKVFEVDILRQETLENHMSLSPWIRMTTPFASGVGGMLMTPEVGSHVLVNYFDSNMEKPYVDGALFCRDQGAPGFKWEYEHHLPFTQAFYPTSKPRVIQSASGHGITFFDGDDKDFLSDHILPILQIALKPFGFNALPCNNGGIEIADTSGFYSINMQANTRTVDINSPLGTVSLNAFTGINIMAPNGDININGKNVNITAGNNITLKAGANVSPEIVPLHTTVSQGLGALTQSIATVGVGVGATMFVDTTFGINLSKVFDVSFLRNLWEVIMRPVEGTLGIETMRNITMKAGKGQPVIPSSLLRSPKGSTGAVDAFLEDLTSAGLGFQKAEERTNVALQADMPKLVRMLRAIANTVESYFNDIEAEGKSLAAKIEELYRKRIFSDSSLAADFATNTFPYPESPAAMYESLRDKTEKLIFSYDTMVEKPMPDIDWEPDHLGVFRLVELYNETITANKALKNKFEENVLLDKLNNAVAKFSFTDEGAQVVFADGDTKSTEQTFYMNSINISDFLIEDYHIDRTAIPKINKLLFYTAIKDLGGTKMFDLSDLTEITKNNVIENWNDFRQKIKEYKAPEQTKTQEFFSEQWKGLTTGLIDSVFHPDEFKKLFNLNGAAGFRATSDVTSGGSILMSNNAGTTLRLSPEGKQFQHFQNPNIDLLKDYLDLAFNPKDDYLNILDL